jgi:hypothetical protein
MVRTKVETRQTRARTSFPGTILLFTGGLVLCPQTAWAIQVHPQPEGLVVHQLAHLFFISAMAILAYWLQSNRLVEERGWRLVQLSCFFFILWNLCAFLGHWFCEKITSDMFIGPSGQLSQRLVVKDLRAVGYYLFHLDHLLCVPAIVFLFLGVRDFYRRARVQELEDHD